MGFGVWSLGFGVWVWGLGFRFRVQGSGFIYPWHKTPRFIEVLGVGRAEFRAFGGSLILTLCGGVYSFLPRRTHNFEQASVATFSYLQGRHTAQVIAIERQARSSKHIFNPQTP